MTAPAAEPRAPLAVGETLTEAFHLYGAAFPRLLLAVCVFSLPLQLFAQYEVQRRFGPAESGWAVALQLALDSISSPFLAASAVLAADAAATGETSAPGDFLRRSARPWLRVLNVQVLSGLLIALGGVAFLVPGVILFGRYALVESVAVLEQPSLGRCLDRSRELVRGVTGRVLLLIAVLELPGLAAASLGGLLTAKPALSGVVAQACAGSLTNLAGMISWIGMFAVYRARSGT